MWLSTSPQPIDSLSCFPLPSMKRWWFSWQNCFKSIHIFRRSSLVDLISGRLTPNVLLKWLHAFIIEWYQQYPSLVTLAIIPTFLQIHIHASSSFSIFSTLMQSLGLIISLDLELAEKITLGLLPFSDLSLDEAFLWVGFLKGWGTLGNSLLWMDSTILSICMEFLCHWSQTCLSLLLQCYTWPDWRDYLSSWGNLLVSYLLQME